MKVIIAGSRTIHSMPLLQKAIADSGFTIEEVVSGGAGGVDKIGEKWAEFMRVPVALFPAPWAKYGKSAGPLRNLAMAKYANALIAIWDGKSRGTKDMIDKATKAGLKVYVLDTSK